MTYKATLVTTLLQSPRLYNMAQQARVDPRSRLQHLASTLRQHLGITVQPRKVQAHQQGARLDIVDAIGEEMGDGIRDLVCGDGGVVRVGGGPETAEEVLDVDDGGRFGRAGGGFDQVWLRAGG